MPGFRGGAVGEREADAVEEVGIRAALSPGGTFVCIDIAASSNLADNLDHPWAAALYAMSTLHALPVSRARGGGGLGSIADAGFRAVEVCRLDGDRVHHIYVAR